MRHLLLIFISSTALVPAATGCGRSAPPEEYGTVVFELPDVPGADEPYKIPELENEPDSDSDQEVVEIPASP